jgi:hypothetical protein
MKKARIVRNRCVPEGSILDRHGIEAAPKVPGRDRTPGPPTLAELGQLPPQWTLTIEIV